MRENYIDMGPDIGNVGLLVLPALVLLGIIYRAIRRRPVRPKWAEIMPAPWCFVPLFVAMPIQWAVAVLILLMGIGTLLDGWKNPAIPSWQRWLTVPASAGIGVLFLVADRSMFNEDVALTSDRVIFRDFDGKIREVGRKGFAIHALRGSRHWLNGRQWWSWTSYPANTNDTGELGPSFAGFQMYMGPDGIIDGDELGRRMAKWAGTQPVYRRR